MDKENHKLFFQADPADAPRRRVSDHMIERVVEMLEDHRGQFEQHAKSTTEYRIANDKRIDQLVGSIQKQDEKIDCLALGFKLFDRDWKKKYQPALDDEIHSKEWWSGTKDETIKNVVKSTVWLAFLGVCYGLWLLVKDSLGIKK